MKAVNLLPEKHRPRKPTGGKSGSGYIALGVLGAVLIAVLVYVFTLNSINSSKTKITEAKADAVRLDSQANTLGPYGDFAKIKTERVRSVQMLAQGRFDWERLVRELATVLPSDVWLVSASASASGDSATPGSSSSTPATPGAPPVSTGPTLSLQGCARDQSQVAVTLVRLRELQGATDVSLDHSTRVEDASTGKASAPSASAAGASGDTSCGTTGGKPNYSFQVNVTFAPSAQLGSEPVRVPARLGGGA